MLGAHRDPETDSDDKKPELREGGLTVYSVTWMRAVCRVFGVWGPLPQPVSGKER